MDMLDIVKKGAEKSGFSRDSYIDANIPTLLSNILVLPFFGDIRSTCIASSVILRRYKELRTNKYLILCSWPGNRALFPYVDEYWSPKDQSAVQDLAANVMGFYNNSDILVNYNRFINNFFEHIIHWEDLSLFYENGFGSKYWDNFKDVKIFLPNVPSSTTLTEDFRIEMGKRSERKIVVFPSKKIDSWQEGRLHRLMTHRDFWLTLVSRLIQEGFAPVVYQNAFTYDLSTDFADKCIWLTCKDIGQVLSALRWADCVLDVHSGVSRLAVASRTPCLIVDERKRYVETKNYELDDITNLSARQYLFSFSTMLMGGDDLVWNTSLIDGIVSRLNKWLPTIDRTAFGSPTESYQVADYDKVRRHRVKRLGIHFIKKH
jgi:hypothetical protein